MPPATEVSLIIKKLRSRRETLIADYKVIVQSYKKPLFQILLDRVMAGNRVKSQMKPVGWS
jgi:hypothetical protein